MLQNLLASIGVLAIIIVTFARMTFQARRPPARAAGQVKDAPNASSRRPF